MKKLGILIYPEFSLQEVGNIMYLFRWYFDSETRMISVNKGLVKSEEGVYVQGEISLDEFVKEDYHCLILPGCSDFRETAYDEKLIDFLRGFKDDREFPIGAICGGPLLLSLAGLLDDKKFTNSLFVEMNQLFKAVKDENIVYSDLVEDGNIITATGDATRKFAIAMARKVGFSCSDEALKEMEGQGEENFKHHLDEEGLKEFKKYFKDLI